MKMIAVRGIVVGSQHRIEVTAGAFVDFTQKPAVAARVSPIVDDADAAPAGENESGDVERIGRCVLAAARALARVHVAAGIAAEMMETRNALPEMSMSRGLQHVMLPHRERHGAAARERERLA